MTIQISRYYGIAQALLAVGAFTACSSDNTPAANPGGAGAPSGGSVAVAAGAGGGSAGSGAVGSGTAGNGGAASGSAGGAGAAAAGGAAGAGFVCAGTKPASAQISEFADLVANPASVGDFTFTLGVPGGTFSYQKSVFTLASAGMALNVKGTVKTYDGFGVYLSACTDASAYTGVSFNIKGSVGPKGTLSFRFQTNADTAVDSVNKKGTCVVPAGTTDAYPLCHFATFDIPVTAGGAVVAVKFSDLMGGVPVAAVTGKDLVGFEWAFNWAGATDAAYDVDVTLDDLKFTSGGAGGGADGAGGAGAGGVGGAGAGAGGA